MVENYYKFIELDREFLMDTHAFKILYENYYSDGLFHQMWFNRPNLNTLSFGGNYGMQFRNNASLMSFDIAFDQLLADNGIPLTHRNHLLYFITLFETIVEKTSRIKFQYNDMLQNARFVIEIVDYCFKYYESIKKNPDYQLLDTQEVVDSGRLIYKSETKTIEFVPIILYQTRILLPTDMEISLNGLGFSSKRFKQTNSFTIPESQKLKMLRLTLNNILLDQKEANTNFYKQAKEIIQVSKFINIQLPNTLKHFSVNDNLTLLGMLVGNYLNQKTPSELSRFLWHYFALIKLLPLRANERNEENLLFIDNCDNYLDLLKFFKDKGVSYDWVRKTIMKDGDHVAEKYFNIDFSSKN